MKSLSFMRRRPGMEREAFVRHYENVHAPMGYTHYPFAKYVRNHVDGVLAGGFDYDVIAEFYPDRTAPQPELSPEVLQAFADDRALFMDTARTGGVVDETVAMGEARDVDPVGLRKFCLITRGRGEAVLATLLDPATARPARRITVDIFQQPDAERPFDTLIWLWADALPDTLLARLRAHPEIGAVIAVRSYETPPEFLLGKA